MSPPWFWEALLWVGNIYTRALNASDGIHTRAFLFILEMERIKRPHSLDFPLDISARCLGPFVLVNWQRYVCVCKEYL